LQLQEQGEIKYGARDLLATSANTTWSGITVEHRYHAKKEIASFLPQNLEVCIATACHSDCVVSRTGDRVRQHARVEPGTIWFCPVGVQEEDIVISEWHDILHLYLPVERFAQLSDERGGADSRPGALPYLGGIYNDQIRRIGMNLLDHLQAPRAAGPALVDTLSLELTACIVDGYFGDTGSVASTIDDRRLDMKRLRHVVDYMTEHLEEDISLSDLAQAANFSTFHFSRVFFNTMGVPPHRYLSNLRLERAKTLLSLQTMPIAQIALACTFSSQSNFSRAFRRATGSTPQAYRSEHK
jgi:AraC family transcriptional regulator